MSGSFIMPTHYSPSYIGSPKDRSTRDSPKGESKTHAPHDPELASPVSHGSQPGRQTRKRLVFADPVAARYLEEDPATHAIERWRRLQGYEMYVVEQWCCSRTHPTFIICTYTGDPTHSIVVNVLSVPSDETTWSPRLQIYFQAVSQHHAKEKDTPLGQLMVTNLSGFPSALTVIPVPDGDVRKHREDFIVNEDLKRMGCSGRGAINLQQPQPSTIAKFHHLYRTSEAVPLYQSVIELVRTCQIALVMYDKIQATYADGLLCDVTEKAVTEWWTDIGTYFYNVEPNDGILGPTTVAALLGLLIGAHNRLKAFGAPVGKDVLDTESMKRAIGHFQKGQKMERTRRLDRETLDRLHRATAKNAAGEGWSVPKSVKSTVAELSGKGGEMVLGIVGGRDKAGISEAETMDIERFAQLVSGPKMKWLWQGKPIKSGDPFAWPTEDADLKARVFSTDDQGNFLWTANQHDSLTDGSALERTDTALTNQTDAKSGRHRFRGAVGGMKSYNHRYQESTDWMDSAATTASRVSTRDHTLRSTVGASGVPHITGPPAFDMALLNAAPTSPKADRGAPQLRRTQTTTEKQVPSHRQQLRPPQPGDSPRRRKAEAQLAELRNEFKADIYRKFSADVPYKGPESQALRRTQSHIQFLNHTLNSPRQYRIPRRLSFSMVESAVLNTGSSVVEEGIKKGRIEGDLTNALAERDALVAAAQKKSKRIQHIRQGLIPYTENRVAHVESLDAAAHEHYQQLNELYYHRLEDYQTLQATSSDVVSQEKSGLAESFRRMEMLGAKMDYELGSLHSRLQEVEDAVDDFERNVLAIEARVKELNGDGESQSARQHWMTRVLNFIGPKK
jgi:hypothetical protein